MTETLYYLTLTYLRKNHQLINFTILNHQISGDLFKVIENPAHLSAITICRRVYDWRALYCYIVKYYKNTKYVEKLYSRIQLSYDVNVLKKYAVSFIDDLYIDSEWVIYEISTRTSYTVKNVSIRAKKYKIINDEFIKNNALMFSPYTENILFSECVFSEILDILEPAERHGYISKKLFIYSNVIKKYGDN